MNSEKQREKKMYYLRITLHIDFSIFRTFLHAEILFQSKEN